MKITRLLILVAATLMLPAIGDAKTVHAVVSSQLPSKGRKFIAKTVMQYGLETLEPGNGIKIYVDKGDSIEELASLELPNYGFYRKNKLKRAEKLAPGIKKLKYFAVQEPMRREQMLGLNVPEIFATMRGIKPDPDGNILLLIGSPVVHCKDEAYSMANNYFPSDGHLTVEPHQSPYSLLGAEKALDGWAVKWAFLKEPFENNNHYGGAVERWWSLYCQHQGARLVNFEVSLKNIVTGLFQSNQSNVPSFTANPDAGFQIIKANKFRRIPKKSDKKAEPTPAPKPKPLSGIEFLHTDRLAQAPLTKLTHPSIKIGLTWEGSQDLDLYVRPNPSAPELSFRKRATPEGKHLKDYVTSPGKDAYEVVELGAVDLSQVVIGVNVFEADGRAKVIPATVRIEVDGKVFSQDITLRTGKGNKGSDRNRSDRENSPYWIVVDALKLVGLR